MLSDSERYKCLGLVTFPLGSGSELAYCPATRRSAIVPAAVAQKLLLCDGFRPLREHAARLRDSVGRPAEEESSLLNLLSRLADAGLLVSLSHIEGAINVRSRNSAPGVGRVCVVTKDRAVLLRRVLDGLARNIRSYGRCTEYAVFDDSVETGAQEECRQAVRDFAVRQNVRVIYIGLEQKRQYADRLIDRGLPEEAVHFAVFGVPGATRRTGANRNALLLLSAAQMVLSVDDDEECELVKTPAFRNVMAYFSGYDPSEYWFFEDRASTLAAVRFTDCDVLGLHERLLGGDLSPGDVRELDVERMDAAFAHRMTSGKGRVLATLAGIVGDCGMATPRWLWLTGRSHARLLASEQSYRSAFISTEVLKVVDCYTISSGRFCMTGSIGLDNRDLLPPFFPIGRNSDGVFGTTLRTCFQDGYFGHLPWAMLHSPDPLRTFPPGIVWTNTSQLDLSDILSALIMDFRGVPGATPEKRMRSLGGCLEELGSAPLADFEEHLKLNLMGSVSRSIGVLLGSESASADLPDYWREDFERFLESRARPFHGEGPLLPRDLPATSSDLESRRLLQHLIRRFGEMLRYWPDMVEASKGFAEIPLTDGVRTGGPLPL